MARFSQAKINRLFQLGDRAPNYREKGLCLENLICYVFEKVPGIALSHRDERNQFRSEEIDIAFWNEQKVNGFYFLPNIIIVECKNWSSAIGSSDVSWFDHKIRMRGVGVGILVAVNGITGDSRDLTNAHAIVSQALSEGRRLIVLKRDEIENLESTHNLIQLIQRKLCSLTVGGAL